MPSFFSRNDLDYLIKEKNQKRYWEVFTFQFLDIISYKYLQNKGDHDLNINLLLFTMHALFVLFNNNTMFQNGWSCIFQIIFWNVLINWFINCVGFTAAYTSNGRQRTAEEDLQEFLNKSPTASRSNEADRLSSHLLRWFPQSDITSIHMTYIQRTHVDRV